MYTNMGNTIDITIIRNITEQQKINGAYIYTYTYIRTTIYTLVYAHAYTWT